MLTIAADERAAMQLDDVASALDAGLPIDSLHNQPSAGERAVHSALQQRGIRLTPLEDVVLLASWRAGRASASLRSCADARRQRAEFQRSLWAALRYPLVLLLATFVATLTTAPIIGHYWLALGVGTLLLTLVGLLVWARASLNNGSGAIARVPIVGDLVTQMAELPYLEILQNMYGSGVPLVQAHATAITAVRLPAVRQRLGIADHAVQSGRTLTDGLFEAMALHPETRSLLANGERAGELEQALGRALKRRREVTAREIAALARRIGAAVYGLAAVIVFVVLYNFYSSYFGLLGHAR